MKHTTCILFIAISLTQCKPRQDNSVIHFAGKPAVPAVIKTEHEYLLYEIRKITLLKDSTGMASIKLYELMQHHFSEEENYVLPPLGCLTQIAEGKTPAQSEELIGLTEKLKAQLNHMLAEHQLIKAYFDELKQAAVTEHHPEVMALEKEVSKHAATEEQVFFPAAIVLGEYLKLKRSEKQN